MTLLNIVCEVGRGRLSVDHVLEIVDQSLKDRNPLANGSTDAAAIEIMWKAFQSAALLGVVNAVDVSTVLWHALHRDVLSATLLARFASSRPAAVTPETVTLALISLVTARPVVGSAGGGSNDASAPVLLVIGCELLELVLQSASATKHTFDAVRAALTVGETVASACLMRDDLREFFAQWCDAMPRRLSAVAETSQHAANPSASSGVTLAAQLLSEVSSKLRNASGAGGDVEMHGVPPQSQASLSSPNDENGAAVAAAAGTSLDPFIPEDILRPTLMELDACYSMLMEYELYNDDIVPSSTFVWRLAHLKALNMVASKPFVYSVCNAAVKVARLLVSNGSRFRRRTQDLLFRWQIPFALREILSPEQRQFVPTLVYKVAMYECSGKTDSNTMTIFVEGLHAFGMMNEDQMRGIRSAVGSAEDVNTAALTEATKFVQTEPDAWAANILGHYGENAVGAMQLIVQCVTRLQQERDTQLIACQHRHICALIVRCLSFDTPLPPADLLKVLAIVSSRRILEVLQVAGSLLDVVRLTIGWTLLAAHSSLGSVDLFRTALNALLLFADLFAIRTHPVSWDAVNTAVLRCPLPPAVERNIGAETVAQTRSDLRAILHAYAGSDDAFGIDPTIAIISRSNTQQQQQQQQQSAMGIGDPTPRQATVRTVYNAAAKLLRTRPDPTTASDLLTSVRTDLDRISRLAVTLYAPRMSAFIIHSISSSASHAHSHSNASVAAGGTAATTASASATASGNGELDAKTDQLTRFAVQLCAVAPYVILPLMQWLERAIRSSSHRETASSHDVNVVVVRVAYSLLLKIKESTFVADALWPHILALRAVAQDIRLSGATVALCRQAFVASAQIGQQVLQPPEDFVRYLHESDRVRSLPCAVGYHSLVEFFERLFDVAFRTFTLATSSTHMIVSNKNKHMTLYTVFNALVQCCGVVEAVTVVARKVYKTAVLTINRQRDQNRTFACPILAAMLIKSSPHNQRCAEALCADVIPTLLSEKSSPRAVDLLAYFMTATLAFVDRRPDGSYSETVVHAAQRLVEPPAMSFVSVAGFVDKLREYFVRIGLKPPVPLGSTASSP